MLPPHVVCIKDCNKPGRRRSLLNACSSACFLALNQAHHANNLETEISRGFDCLNRGSSGGADIIHNHNARPFFPEALILCPVPCCLSALRTKNPSNSPLVTDTAVTLGSAPMVIPP